MRRWSFTVSALAKYSGCADVQCAVPGGDDLTFIEEDVLRSTGLAVSDLRVMDVFLDV